ncbi:hypothetical protein [Fimbriimonas ginsengisoli]|uniref:EF-hand domain-containing protein n=1 Tax=Fimbriimonas ginsengisoli Gsoil 348 TaxID=661478 RepID=A0A068NQ46_FIMGI|nr:hypothetical protein [Fimbriimonas ginsengisoli]AIE84880.1 hypothetical protein OP10G_1512 [Fimbriimonas ginsengisoli Gsoil 348]
MFIAWIAGLCLTSTVHAAQKPPPDPTFAEVTTREFDRWDANHNGILESSEIWKAFEDPANKDVAGAALAAIAYWYYTAPWLPDHPKSFFQNYRPQKFPPLPKDTPPAEAARIRRERAMAGPTLQWEYTAALWRLRHAPTFLFSPEGPKLSDVHEGWGYCWFISHVGAVVHRDPYEIKQMIHETDKGYHVTFPDDVTVDLPPLTDAQRGIYDVKVDNGLWVRVLRMAFFRRPPVTLRGPKGNLYPHVAKAMEGLTGFAMKAVPLVNDYAKVVPTENLDRLATDVRRQLTQTLAAKKLVIVDSGLVPLPFGMTGNHSYAAFNFDPENDTVTLWNPWGDTSRPRAVPGRDPDYPRTGGVFTVPLKVMVRSFKVMYFELNDLYRR